jgi:hypothetical protein
MQDRPSIPGHDLAGHMPRKCETQLFDLKDVFLGLIESGGENPDRVDLPAAVFRRFSHRNER